MTCSASIVHFNFPLNSEISLIQENNNKEKYLSSSESSEIIFSDRKSVEEESPPPLDVVQQMIKSKSSELESKQAAVQNEKKTYPNSNMNNGLSNGHDLNLVQHSGNNNTLESNSTSSIFNPLSTITAAAAVVASSPATDNIPVSSISSSNSFPNNNNNTDTMGILNTSDKHNLPPNCLLFNKVSKTIENGQKLSFVTPAATTTVVDQVGWADLQPKLVDQVDVLPQINQTSDKEISLNIEVNSSCNQIANNGGDRQNSGLFDGKQIDSLEAASVNISNSKSINFEFETVTSLNNSGNGNNNNLCSSDLSSSELLSLTNQPLFHENNLLTDSVPNESNNHDDLCTEQQVLQKQTKQLCKRIRRVQLQQTHRNVTKQMKLFLSLQQKLNSINCQSFNFDFTNSLQTPTNNASQLKELLLQKDLTKNEKQNIHNNNFEQPNSTSYLSAIQHFHHPYINDSKSLISDSSYLGDPLSEFSTTFQQSHHHPDLSSLSFANRLQDSLYQSNQCNIVPKALSQDNKDRILATIDTLRFNLRHIESKYDSDATDSSSGGESCDELEDEDVKPTYSVAATAAAATAAASSLPATTPVVKKYIPIRERSVWKWCNERSAIASRWSWLHAQITDLETKLRQQNEIFRHLRATKGSICFGENESNQRNFPSPQNSSHVNNTNASNQATTSSTLSSVVPGNNAHQQQSSSTTTNIVHPTPYSDTAAAVASAASVEVATAEQEAVSVDEENSCMRTMPFQSMKRRKLVLAEKTLSIAMRKSVKYSSIQCSCNLYTSFVPPCVICNGRYSYMHSIETDFMPYNERVSLLDSSCHPVLCLPNEVSLGLHFMQFLKRESLNNNRPLLLRNKKKKICSAISADGSTKNKKLLLSNIPSKIKKKSDKIKKRRLSADSSRKIPRDRLSSGCSSRAESPVPSPSPSDGSSNGASATNQSFSANSAPLHRRRRSEQHAFDINNIVIPYSIAASTRVEKLQYKEIVTPKWRVNEGFAIPPPESVLAEIEESQTIDLENITEEEFITRHSKCEELERQRIMSYYVGLKNKNVRKGTPRVRFESGKSESQDQSSQDSCSSKVKSKAKNDYLYERKRNSSISKSLSREDTLNDDFNELVVSPYDQRLFPLSDDVFDVMLQEINDEALQEEQLANSHHDASKSYDADLNDSTDEETHISNSIVSSPANTEMDIGDDYGHRVASRIDLCEDDPEWKPTKI